MKQFNITKNAKLCLLGAAALLFSTSEASAQVQWNATVNSGSFASAIGSNTNATGENAFSSGYATTASGAYSSVFNAKNEASGSFSNAFGLYCYARSTTSIAAGFYAETGSTADNSMALGTRVTANGYRSMVIGSGYQPGGAGAAALINGNDNSLMIGFNSNRPSLYVGPSSGVGTTGRVAIGTTNTPLIIGGQNISNYRLFVAGGILADEVRVRTGWADYVFTDDYKLPTLTEVGAFIDENGHLPNVPSAQQVEEEGIEIGEITRIQQEKIEELTLYMIEMQKEIEALKSRLDEQGN